MNSLEEFVNRDNQITEELSYDNIIQKLQEAKDNEIPIEEGILGAIGGFIAGATLGPKLGKAICKALGIDEKGPVGNVVTSRLVTTAIGTTMGWKM